MHTILIVDDDVPCREMVAGALQKQGFATTCAADNVAALAQMETKRPDLVLLEAHMPKVNGEMYLQAIRRDARFRRLPVIVLTHCTSKDFVQRVSHLGVQGYLLKGNLSPTELIGRINRCLALDLHELRAASRPAAPRSATV